MSDVADVAESTGMHTLSVVIPVYQGERTLPALIKEIEPLTTPVRTPDGHAMRVTEVILVYDHGPDSSDQVMRQLADDYDFVRPIWLSRNFGQHAATLAGMSSSGGDWIATLDEDGQHDPATLGTFLDAAISEQAAVVYGSPVNTAPHGAVRNVASRVTKRILARLLDRDDMAVFQSYRLMLGEIGRSVAAYAGAGVFLDVAMSWVNDRLAVVPIKLRSDADRASGYTMRRLLSHFWRMVLTSGTRGLRLVSILGVVFAVVGLLLAMYVVIARLFNEVAVQGWASVMVAVLLGTGAILFALGVVAEYIGVAVNMAMGKPLYLIVSDPADSPLARRRSAPE